jgi:hypothetical protein
MNPYILKIILSLCDADSLDSIDGAIPEWHKIIRDIRFKLLEQKLVWKYTIYIHDSKKDIFCYTTMNFWLEINKILYYGIFAGNRWMMRRY